LMTVALPPALLPGASETGTGLTANFYRAFEDRHRGSRELIKSRLQVYLPLVLPLAGQHPQASVLDLGCGRGEWLELLQQHHIKAQGVDLDEGMLAACRERHLDVTNADAMAHLKQQADQSLLVLSGFHIAEHLPFEVLQELFVQAHRVLLPDGLFILETPNPENLVVGTVSFYLDPSHLRPLPPQLLTFLAQHQGFAQVQLLRLQEEARLATDGPLSLYDVLAGVSPDYAIVARIQADPVLPEPAPGASLYALALRYDQQLQVHLAAQQQAQLAAQARAEEALIMAGQVQQQAEEQALQQTQHQIHQHTQQQVQQQAAQLAALYASLSWRFTRPLRWLGRLLRSPFNRP
jgi:SAM-dependent methyltransferase